MTDPPATPLAVLVHALVDHGELLHQVFSRMDDAPLSAAILADLLVDLLEPALEAVDDDELLAAALVLGAAADAIEDGLFFVAPRPEPCSGRVRRANRRGLR